MFRYLCLAALPSVVCIANDNNSNAQMRSLENRVTALEQKKGANGMVNPPARPYAQNAVGMFITGDVLLWKATENGLPYVFVDNNADGQLTRAHAKDPNFKWDWGFRLGVGGNLPHDGWDLYLTWTHFHTLARASESTPFNGTLVQIWGNPATDVGAIEVDAAKARWKLRLNVADLELGREFFVSRYLTLRPHAGLRSLWDHQRYRVGYVVNSLTNETLTIPMKNHFWGLGLRTGLNTLWGFGGGFGFFANTAVSLMFGNIHIQQHETHQPDGNSHLGVKYRNDITRAVTDLAAGFRWDESFCKESFHLGIALGWEQHMFFGQNQLMRFCDDNFRGAFTSNQGDLTTQGFFLSILLDF